jgi:hypothetical protein
VSFLLIYSILLKPADVYYTVLAFEIEGNCPTQHEELMELIFISL